MKASDRSILFGLLILGLLACFWFMLLAPKRERASELETKLGNLQEEVAQQEELAVAAEQARGDYEQNYERLVVLGKAAPADGDTPSLLTQLTAMADASHTKFGSLIVGGEEAVAAPPPATETTTDQNAEAEAGGESEEGDASETPPTATPPAVPTEAVAATLPLGATVGPAGLGVMPYSLTFEGNFFQVADLLERLDDQIGTGGKGTSVDGRLMTINGFSMASSGASDQLSVDLSITTYVLPDSQGLTAGATPAAPAPAVPPAAPVPTSTTPAP